MTRRCECAACRARNERDYWAIVRGTWETSDEDSLEREAVADVRHRWEDVRARAIARGAEDGA